MPQLPVGNITFSLSGHKFEMSAPDLLVSLHPSVLHRSSVEEGKKEERAACASLVRSLPCSCRDLIESRAQFDPNSAGHGYGYGKISVHDPRCPESIAAAIEARK